MNKELKDFAHIVSHDLKAPLRGVSQLAEWIAQDNQEKLDKSSKENLNLLKGRVKRMANLIDGILQYSRAGRTQEQKKEVDLNDMIRNIIEDLAPPKKIQVEIENTLPVIHAEKVKIQQVFQNLISNAIKYMDKSKGKVQVGSAEKNGFLEFHVSDNGPGIDKKYHETIFKIFQTLEARDQRESTGVGLSVVKKIVEQNGGKIRVESTVGEGSTFYFTVAKK